MEYTYNGLRVFWNTDTEQANPNMGESYTANARISDVIGDSDFGDYSRLIFPANTGYYRGNTLGELGLTWG